MPSKFVEMLAAQRRTVDHALDITARSSGEDRVRAVRQCIDGERNIVDMHFLRLIDRIQHVEARPRRSPIADRGRADHLERMNDDAMDKSPTVGTARTEQPHDRDTATDHCGE